MEFVNGFIEKELEPADYLKMPNQIVKVKGVVHKIREMSGFSFVVLRTKRDTIQCVYTKDKARLDLKNIGEEYAVIIEGEVIIDDRASAGFELHIIDIEVKSKPAEQLPITINKKALDINIDTALDYRPVSLRNPKEKAVFKIQEGLARGFREYLLLNNFTEVRTPKIVFAGAEGGANIFKLDYFGKQVYLTQSPQFYKQIMVGVYERVFEIAPVFRAEKHNTSRHLNEYTSMDFEMGFINSFYDIMNTETQMLKYIFILLEEEYSAELKILNMSVPNISEIPVIKFMEAKEIISKIYKREVTDFDDFEPEEEKLIGQYIKEKYNNEFVFVTHYPSRKRPFYAMDDKNDVGYTLSFDLLMNGAEITTGGQRIHDYKEQIEKMKSRGMNPGDFESYLMLHRYGVPPHGGLGLGLERITMKLLGISNVRNATLFPRDVDRVTP